MGATRNTGYLENLIQYDASDNVAIATSVNPSYKVTLGGSMLGTSAVFSGLVTANANIRAAGIIYGRTTNNFPTTGAGYYAITTNNFDAERGGITIQVSSATNTLTTALSINYLGAATFSTSATTAISVNSTGTASGIQLKNTGGTASDWVIQSDGGAVAGQAAFRIYSVTASQYRMSIDGSGNVGIGVTSTVGKLDIATGGNTNIVISNDSTDTGYNIVSLNGTRTKGSYAGIAGGGTGDNNLYLNSGNSVVVQTGGSYTERMRIRSGGEVSFIPTTWTYVNPSTSYRNMDFGAGGWLYRDNSDVYLTSNNYYNTSGQWVAKYSYNQGVGILSLAGGNFTWNSYDGNVTAGIGYSLSPRFLITSGGDVAIGVTSASYRLHIKAASGSTTGIRLDSSGGTSSFDLLSSEGDGNAYLYLRSNYSMIFGTNNTQRMRIDASGNVTFGVTSAYDTALLWRQDFTGAIHGRIYASGAPRIVVIAGESNGVQLTSGATSWTSNSDERLKNINGIIENAVDDINKLRAVKFSWKADKTNKENIGLIAQDIEAVFPQIVDKDENDILGVRYTEMIPVLVRAIQEQQKQIEELKSKLS